MLGLLLSYVRKMLRAMFSQRGVNAMFVLVCVAGAMGAPGVAVMVASAVLYAVLVMLG